MDKSALQSVQDIIDSRDPIAIVVGKNPAVDEMGAALALYLSLKSMGKTVSIASASQPLVEISSLVGIDKVKTMLSGEEGDLIVSFPYKKSQDGISEIEKVSYTLDEGFLNIIVKPGANGLSFDERQVQYKRSGGIPSVLFVVGTSRLSDLGSLFNPDELKDTTVVNIDNKESNQGFGDVVLVSSKYTSVSEQVASLMQSLQWDLDQDSAQNLLAGISHATHNFQDPKTSYLAFEMSAILMKKGATRMQLKQEETFAKEDPFFGSVNLGQRLQQKQNDFKKRQDDTFPPKQSQFPQRKPQVQQQQVQPQSARGVQLQGEQALDRNEKDDQDTPPDWLTPKVYKGSTLI